MLSTDELTRYSRHLLLPEIGLDGQKRLKAARVLIAGSGGLGSPAALYLAAAGVGTIGLADFDTVDLSNLQRQILFSAADVGKSKVQAASGRVAALNPDIKVVAHDERIAAANVLQILGDYDMVVDGTDNFATRYLLNDACVRLKKPYVYGSIYRFEGQATIFLPGAGCYRCLFPQMPDAGSVPNCQEIGVLGAVAGIIGVIQATEALKLIVKAGESLSGRLLILDALSMRFSELPLSRDQQCTVCGDTANSSAALVDEELQCAAETPRDLSPTELAALIKDKDHDLLLLDVRTPQEFVFCNLPGAVLIPLDDLPARVKELQKEQHIVVYCHYGIRSRTACQILQETGFAQISNLKGGIAAWSRDVDRSVPQY